MVRSHSISKSKDERPSIIPRSTLNFEEPAVINETFHATSSSSVATVVTAALAFKASLTTAQQAVLQQTYTTALARKWSNLPCGSG